MRVASSKLWSKLEDRVSCFETNLPQADVEEGLVLRVTRAFALDSLDDWRLSGSTAGVGAGAAASTGRSGLTRSGCESSTLLDCGVVGRGGSWLNMSGIGRRPATLLGSMSELVPGLRIGDAPFFRPSSSMRRTILPRRRRTRPRRRPQARGAEDHTNESKHNRPFLVQKKV